MQAGEEKSVALEFARGELARAEKVFELIAARRLALQTGTARPARVRLTRKAEVPLGPLQSMPYKILFLACSAGLVAPFGLALAREITVRRVTDVEQFAEESKLRVLGEVSKLPVRFIAVSSQKHGGRLRREMDIFAESINSLRTHLSIAEGLDSQQVVAIASSVSGEGKSSIATSLAMNIATTTNRPTLIIDADLRSPDVATMLKVNSQPGLHELLSGKCRLEEAVHRVDHTQLYVIPGGQATKNPHRLLRLAETQKLLDQVRSKFSSIVIDTPPILGASESLVIAKAADVVLFCSLCDVSRVKQVRLAIERLHQTGANVAGAVLSGTPARRYEHVYGYYASSKVVAEITE